MSGFKESVTMICHTPLGAWAYAVAFGCIGCIVMTLVRMALRACTRVSWSHQGPPPPSHHMGGPPPPQSWQQQQPPPPPPSQYGGGYDTQPDLRNRWAN